MSVVFYVGKMGNCEDSTDLIQDVGGFNMSYESYDHIFWNENLLVFMNCEYF